MSQINFKEFWPRYERIINGKPSSHTIYHDMDMEAQRQILFTEFHVKWDT